MAAWLISVRTVASGRTVGISTWKPAAALAASRDTTATGAFCYPHDRWNSDPRDIDGDHARLWSVSDAQILRCWKAGLSPQNFGLFDRAAVRQIPRE